MAQSYETNQRLPFLVCCAALGLLLLLLWLPVRIGLAQPPAPQDSRGAQFFPYLEYRFTVPEAQADAVWEYLLAHFGPKAKPRAAETQIVEEQLTDLYFDTPQQELRRRNLALRQRLFISAEGRKQHLQLLLPPPPHSALGKEVRFRQNKRPDKGKAFTNHPVLKLLRTKDRPRLDSLLRPYQIAPEALQTALEINQDRRQFQVRRQGEPWLTLTLTHLVVQAPERQRIELQLQADPNTLRNASAAQQQQLVNATQNLVRQFKKEFPELEQVREQEYGAMAALRQQPVKHRLDKKVVFGVSIVVLAVTLVLVQQFRRKPLYPIG